MTARRSIAVDALILDARAQPRAQLNWLVVAEYVEALGRGDQFPPVVAFGSRDAAYLADGWHRVHAMKEAGISEIPIDLHPGELRDAILYACGTNATHGLRRTNADKRRAVETLLNDPEWSAWSDHEIARRCAVSQPMVSAMRAALATNNGYQSPVERRGADGRTINTTNIGRRAVSERPGGDVFKLDAPPPQPDRALSSTSDMTDDCHPARYPDADESASPTSAPNNPDSVLKIAAPLSSAAETERLLRSAPPEFQPVIDTLASADELLKQPDNEKAYQYAYAAQIWMRFDPSYVADAAQDPGRDAPDWRAFGQWALSVADALEARAKRPIRLVGER